MQNKLFSFTLSALVLLAMADLKVFSSPGIAGGDKFEKAKRSLYHLPEGITLSGKPQGPDDDCYHLAVEANTIKGSGGSVRMCMTFRNATSENITVNLPAGLTFISETTGDEAGVLLQDVDVEVGPYSESQILLYAYSLDLNHHFTSGKQDVYEMGPVTDHAGIQEITRLIAELAIDENRGDEPEENDRLMYIGITLQDAVYSVLLHKELTEEDREAIQNLH